MRPARTIPEPTRGAALTSGADGETLVGPGMKDSRLWEPVVRQLRHSSPGETAFLTASAECPAPAFGDLGSKGSQRIPVGWDCMVVEEVRCRDSRSGRRCWNGYIQMIARE